MKFVTITVVVLALSLLACGSETESGDSKPVVAGVDWSGHGIALKYPEGMRVRVKETSRGPEVNILENPEKRSSVSVAIYLLPGVPAAGSLDLHRKTAAATTRKGLEADGVKFAPDTEIEREIAGVMRKGTVLEFDFGPAHYRLEMYSIELGGRLVNIVLRHEPHEKEIALKAFDTMAKTLAAATK